MSFISRMRAEIAAKRIKKENEIKALPSELNDNSSEKPKNIARIHTMPELTQKDYDSFEICLSFIPELNNESVEPVSPAKTNDPTL